MMHPESMIVKQYYEYDFMEKILWKRFYGKELLALFSSPIYKV